MARLVSSGFELNSAAAAVEFYQVNGAVSISSTTVHTGGGRFSGKISSLSSGVRQDFRMQAVAEGTGGNGPYFGRVYLNVETRPSAENRILSFRDTAAGVDKLWFTLDSGGLLRLYNAAGTQIGSASSALTNGQWYRLEFRIDATPAAGSQVIEGAIDGSVFATSSAQTIATNAGDTIRAGGNGNAEAQTQGTWYFDDMAINDSTGSFQTSYPGAGYIVHLQPQSSGDAASFATQTGGLSGGAFNYSRVQEVPPDDATTFNGSNTSGEEDLFSCQKVLDIGRINVVALGFRFRNNTADATTAIKVEAIKTSGGTKSQSAAIVPNATGFKTNATQDVGTSRSPVTLYQDPDSVNWTQTTLNTMQIGYTISTGGTNRIEVTTVWALIESDDKIFIGQTRGLAKNALRPAPFKPGFAR